MGKFLFVFGYESPIERATSSEQGADFESSNAVWVEAANKEEAMAAGRNFAESWVGNLFRTAQIVGYEGWTAGNFAHWIEEQPLERFSGLALETFEEISAEFGPVPRSGGI